MRILNKLFLFILFLNSGSIFPMQFSSKKTDVGLGHALSTDERKVSDEEARNFLDFLNKLKVKDVDENNAQELLQKYLPKDLANIVHEYATEWKMLSSLDRIFVEDVEALLLLPDGRLASGDSKNLIRIWDLKTKKCIKDLDGHTDWVVDLCSLSKNQLASASWDKTIKIWNLDLGECIKTLSGHRDHVDKVCLLPNGNLASSSSDYTIKIWNLTSGECLLTLPESFGPSMCVSSDNRFLISAGNGGIKVYDIKNNFKIVHKIKGNSKTVCPLPDNKIAYSLVRRAEYWYLGADAEIVILDLNTGHKLKTFWVANSCGNVDNIDSILLIQDNKLIFSYGSHVNILDLKSNKVIRCFHASIDVKSMVILPDGNLAVGNSNGTSIWGSELNKLKRG